MSERWHGLETLIAALIRAVDRLTAYPCSAFRGGLHVDPMKWRELKTISEEIKERLDGGKA